MKKILVVDDENVSLMMTENILAERYDVSCASSGEQAVEMFGRQRPDMVLSDLRMPGMSGYELQHTLNEKAGRAVPFMFMTADTDDATESRGFENGALDFIRKPFRADVLLRRVGNILRAVDMKRAATTDPMTGLLNKSSAHAAIGEMCRTSQGVLMMVDLDSFKPVNDIYGHSAGDMILVRFAEILQAVVRSSDVVGRIGGDEFIVFCQNVREEIVIEKKSRFINRCIVEAAQELLGKDCAIPLGASIGCAFAPTDGTEFAELSQKADKALYEVKRNGKHGFRFYSSVDSSQKQKNGKDALSAVVQILGERTKEKGAFVLPFEQFRSVYRFLVRLNANYGTRSWLVTLNIRLEDGLDSAKICEDFLSALRPSLRKSDVVTESARGQFLVLLMHSEFENIDMILDRIRVAWKNLGGSLLLESEVREISSEI